MATKATKKVVKRRRERKVVEKGAAQDRKSTRLNSSHTS